MYLLKLVKYCAIPNKRLFLCNMLKSRIVLLAIVAVCFFAACKNDPAYDPKTQLAIDDGIIKAYLDSNNIKGLQKTPEGIYYTITNAGPGTDPRPLNLVDTAKIHFVGRLLSNQVLFDSTATNDPLYATKFVLRDAIQGWQDGIPLIKTGGRIRLIVPSPLAYQNRQINTIIKANSILDFDIQLISITNPTIKP